MKTSRHFSVLWPQTILLLLLAGLSALGQAIYEPYTFTTLAGQAGGAGDADGTGPDARFNIHINLMMARNGDLYTMGMGSDNHRKITPAGAVTTEPFIAGCDIQAIDRAGNFYGVSRLPNRNSIYKISPDGSRERVADQAGFKTPAGLVVDDAGTLY